MQFGDMRARALDVRSVIAICLADAVDVDLEGAFVDTMRQLDAYLCSEGAVE